MSEENPQDAAQNMPREEIPHEQTANEPPADETTSSAEPVAETEQAAIINLQSEKNMEVHHHTHPGHHKKKWTDYFWEFLMLFLAVFCGFLAEYQLEHVIEHQREKQYIESLVEDLKSDQEVLSKHIEQLKSGTLMMDSLINILNNPPQVADSERFCIKHRKPLAGLQ